VRNFSINLIIRKSLVAEKFSSLHKTRFSRWCLEKIWNGSVLDTEAKSTIVSSPYSVPCTFCTLQSRVIQKRLREIPKKLVRGAILRTNRWFLHRSVRTYAHSSCSSRLLLEHCYSQSATERISSSASGVRGGNNAIRETMSNSPDCILRCTLSRARVMHR